MKYTGVFNFNFEDILQYSLPCESLILEKY